MAEHIKLARTAAKAGVTMALVALSAGAAANALGETTRARAAAPGFKELKLNVKGLSPELRHDFTSIEEDFNFVSRVMEAEGIFYYFEHGGAGHRLLTVGNANARFLPINAANAKFLQGVSGAATLSGSAQQKLLSIPGFEVDVSTNVDGSPSVTINNGTGVALPAVQDQGGTDANITLAPGKNSLTLTLQNGIDQLRLQTFPADSFNRVLTLTISITFNAAQARSSFAGQLTNGTS